MARYRERLALGKPLHIAGRDRLDAALVAGVVALAAACQDVAVTAVAVGSVEIRPESASVVVDDSRQLSAIITDGAGHELKGRTVTWSSDEPDIAEVGASGVVTAKGVGTTRVVAMVEGRMGEATINVLRKPVGSVTIDPGELTLREGREETLRASVKAEDGTELTDHEVSWTSSDDDIVRVEGQGPNNLEARVRADACPRGDRRCSAQIIASAEDIADTATITVRKGAVRIEITSDRNAPYVMLPGATMELAANVEASDGTDLTDVEAVTWTSSDEDVASVDETGKVTAVGCQRRVLSCEATISAAVDGADDVSDDVEVQVVKIATAISISPAEVTDTLDPAETVTLTANATADDGATDLSEARPITWHSSASVTAQVSTAEGETTVVTARDPACPAEPVCVAGITAEVDGVSDTVRVQVRKAVATVSVVPSSVTVPLLFPYEQSFTATALAEDNTPLPGRSITWMSTVPGAQDSPCGEGAGLTRVTLNPTEGPTTAARVPRSIFRSLVWIWAEAEGVVGCATLQVGS